MIRTKPVDYKHGDVELQGWAAWDDSKKTAPGVLVSHEWWGHGVNARRRAERLAGLGYTAFALDMYGKGVLAKTADAAGKLAGPFFEDRTAMRARAAAGLEQLEALPGVDGSRLAAIGYCFGGAISLELARMGAELRGVVSFHGILATTAPAEKRPKAAIAVFHGAEDGMVNGQLAAFQDEMRRVKADWQLTSYGNAVHSFSVVEAGDDPSTGMAYDQAADERSWRALESFLAEIFRS